MCGRIGFKNNITVSPSIDDLFSGGLEMRQLYSHKWCAPTRASLMTGRLPYHTGVEHGSLGSYAAPEQYLAMHNNYSFLPRTMKGAGYRTHMLGTHFANRRKKQFYSTCFLDRVQTFTTSKCYLAGKWNLGFWHTEATPV